MDSSLQLEKRLARRGITRREFMKFCAAMAATLALPARYTPRIAAALNEAARTPLVWLEFQDCAGNTESFLRASNPTVVEIVLEILSVNYHETIMAPAGRMAEKSLLDTVEQYPGQYIAVVEGSIPTKDGGVYCTIGGRTALDIVREVCGKALATIAVGACAWDGGWPAASPNPTGAVGVQKAVPGLKNLINMPGCPMNVANLTAVIVHFLTFNELPATDVMGRPLFAYGHIIHNYCPRRGHFDAGRYVEEWGDEGHRKGWCLYKMGCKGPQTYSNCPTVLWNDGTNWPIGASHGCVGCMAPAFWDTMTPFYERLPKAQVEGFGVEASADTIGLAVVGGVTAAFAAHGVVSAVRARRQPLASHEEATLTATTEKPDNQ
ncbi:MAG: hydrogenase small subunit [Chloroflexi bacterium]|nr:hydrogenase small subunit [Chloroflexota bacterium]